jgi:uncharacterized protein
MDLSQLKSLALSKKKIFKKTCEKLRKQNPHKTDKIFHELHNQEFSTYDCLDCANCCRTLGPRLSQLDIDRMASAVKMKSNNFFDTYLKIDEDGDFVFKNMPCPFLLDDNYCLIYESRPKACREYPHTNQKNIKTILNLCIKNSETCPIVFNILEKLENQ